MSFTSSIKKVASHFGTTGSRQEDHATRILLGRLFAEMNNRKERINNIQEVEFKVYSQWGDDGIIQYLINKIPVENKIFVEFGVENYTEANTRFLLVNNNWKGLIMDGSEEHMFSVQKENFYWQYDLTAKPHFITRENINQLLTQYGIAGKIGLLHIDIDGNDYYVWEKIDVIQPDIVIVEYNSVFGNQHPISIPYKVDFNRTTAHYTNLYWGVSLNALCYLAKKRGYTFVGTNGNGNNAYFVVNSKADGLPHPTMEEGFTMSNFRESRNEQGQLTYLSGSDRLKAILDMQVYNVETKQLVSLGSLYNI